MRLLGDSQFGVCTFFGNSEDGGEKYGPNGLPLTPASIRILGRFQKLKSIDHSYLCKYLDIQRGKYDRLFLITERNSEILSDVVRSELKETEQRRFSFQILKGLSHLHSQGIVHGCLSLSTVEVLSKTKGQRFVRLNLYGLPNITDSGRDVDFSIGFPWYLAPEVVASDFHPDVLSNPKIDIWAFGILMLELICGIKLCDIWKIKQMMGVLVRLCHTAENDSGLRALITALKLAQPSLNLELTGNYYDLIEQCLSIFPSKRPTAEMLLESSMFADERYEKESLLSSLDKVFLCCNRTADLTPESFRDLIEYTMETKEWLERPVRERPMEEVYHLWKLAGSSVEVILKRKGLTKVIAPIKSIPRVVVEECDVFGNEMTRRYITDLSLVPLSMENLEQRLRAVEPECFFQSLELRYNCARKEVQRADSNPLPAVVKERDIEYQLSRMILFDRLINAYPLKKSWLWQESRRDIPPLYRGYVWAALLGVKSDVSLVYDAVDKETYTPTDRQIEVDIPRCHQYDELLSSPEGHGKFKRILKAWVISHPEYVYWQGLDSLSAPFLYLNFNNEALAYASLTAFIPRYLHKFFLKDNAAIIQEYLAVFSHLITFHDPVLSLHLQEIGFVPELYAIPWFLTMFAHVFPLHKLFQLWDTLLLGDSSFPLCVGVAILLQLRDRLMHYGFNECILLFSDLPEVDIARCVEDSVRLFCRTPKSTTYRQHALSSDNKTQDLHASAHREDRGGSFTLDAIQLSKPELGMDPIPLAELKMRICGRLSAEELVDLSERKVGDKPTVAVDVRTVEEFNRGTFPGSINIPHASLSTQTGTGQLELEFSALDRINKFKGHSVIVVIGTRKEQSYQFAEALIRKAFSRVCVLHKGIDVFRQANMLGLPPTDW